MERILNITICGGQAEMADISPKLSGGKNRRLLIVDGCKGNEKVNAPEKICRGGLSGWLAGSTRGAYGQSMDEINLYIKDIRSGWMKVT